MALLHDDLGEMGLGNGVVDTALPSTTQRSRGQGMTLILDD